MILNAPDGIFYNIASFVYFLISNKLALFDVI